MRIKIDLLALINFTLSYVGSRLMFNCSSWKIAGIICIDCRSVEAIYKKFYFRFPKGIIFINLHFPPTPSLPHKYTL